MIKIKMKILTLFVLFTVLIFGFVLPASAGDNITSNIKNRTARAFPSVTIDKTCVAKNDVVRVSWSNFGGNVNVEVRKGGNFWVHSTIDASDNSYADLHTGVLVNGTEWEIRSDYRIKVELRSNQAIYNYSDWFAVKNPSVTINETSVIKGGIIRVNWYDFCQQEDNKKVNVEVRKNGNFWVHSTINGSHYDGINGIFLDTGTLVNGTEWETCSNSCYNVKVELRHNTSVNKESQSFSVLAPPDLIVDDIWTEPSNPEVGDSVKLYARIKNIGNSTASNIRWNYYINGSYIDDDTHSSLSPGSSREEYESGYTFNSSGNYTYKVKIEAVTGETNTSNNEKTKNVSVTSPPYINLSSTSYNFGYDGGNKSINVTSNVSWSVSDNQTWLSVSPSSGSNNGNFSISCQANNLTSQRSGTVTVSGGGISKQIQITQTAAPSQLNVDPTSYNFGYDGGNKSINVTSNVSWSVSDNQTWLSVSPSNGSNNGNFSISCQQ
ncbi:exported hypothetical protein [Candidatus Magnetomoraceae bacterium gMMP-1]